MMDGYGRGWGYGFDMMGGGWLAGLLMLFFAALVVAGIVLLVVWIVRTSASPHGPTGTTAAPGARGHDEALAIVKRRYAAGEITKEQYEEMMRTLSG
jgi:putative membrane protein